MENLLNVLSTAKSSYSTIDISGVLKNTSKPLKTASQNGKIERKGMEKKNELRSNRNGQRGTVGTRKAYIPKTKETAGF